MTQPLPYMALRQQARRPAEGLLGLPMPFVLFIEPTNICNLRCKICPESLPNFQQDAGYYQAMKPTVWREIVSQLEYFPGKLKSVRFYGIGEPLLNRELCKMIREARPYTERIELSTNGALLGTYAREIAAAPIDYLRISIYGTSDRQIFEETGRRLTIASLQDGALEFRNARHGTTPWLHAQLTTPNQDIELFRRQWEGIADDWAVQELNNWGGTESELVNIGSKPVTPRLVCPKPFYEMMIKANGDVSACCVDWDGRLHLGNILEETLQDIWTGNALREIRRAHLDRKRGELPACQACTLIESQPDNMDALCTPAQSGVLA